jgi:putative membrane protein insertion efficiency factor
MKKILIASVKFYQRTLSIWLGPCCRFYPSCSHYALEALEKYTLPKALFKIVWRLLRCGPWSKGGHDPA